MPVILTDRNETSTEAGCKGPVRGHWGLGETWILAMPLSRRDLGKSNLCLAGRRVDNTVVGNLGLGSCKEDL